jgi:hypothetical protein
MKNGIRMFAVTAGIAVSLTTAITGAIAADNIVSERIFGTWRVQCKRDVIDDSVMCVALARTGSLMVGISSTKAAPPYGVRIGSRHHPRSSMFLRIDDGSALRSDAPNGWIGRDAEHIIGALRSAQKVVTRYTRYPNERVDGEVSMEGYSEAVDHMLEVMQKEKEMHKEQKP